MKVYLAHNYAAKEFLYTRLERFRAAGIEVTSRWIAEDTEPESKSDAIQAAKDFNDIDAADAIVFFACQYGYTLGRGKYIELGYAMARDKIVIIVGGDRKDSVFYAWAMWMVKTISEAIELLQELEPYAKTEG